MNKYNKNKFHSLNFNLKNEIMVYMPLESLFQQISKISKSFKYALDNCGYIKILSKHFKDFLKEIDTNFQSIQKIKGYFIHFNLTNEKLNEIYAFLLLRKKLLFGDCLKLFQLKGFAFEILLELVKHERIKILHFSISGIGDSEEKLNLFYQTLLRNKSIERLSLTRNNIGKVNKSFKKHLFDFFAENSSLKFMDLDANCVGLHEPNMQVFCEAVGKNNSISELDISHNNLAKNENNFKFFSDFLITKNNQLQILILDNNAIGGFESDMKHLAEGLVFNSSLQKIKLSFNKIGQNLKDVFWLCEVFVNNKSLNFIDLSHNLIGGIKKDIENICEALRHNEGLIFLDLENNSIENENEFLEKLAEEKRHLEVKWKNEFFTY